VPKKTPRTVVVVDRAPTDTVAAGLAERQVLLAEEQGELLAKMVDVALESRASTPSKLRGSWLGRSES
jgi:hypothetical protein